MNTIVLLFACRLLFFRRMPVSRPTRPKFVRFCGFWDSVPPPCMIHEPLPHANKLLSEVYPVDLHVVFSPLLIVFSASLILHLIWLNCIYVNLTVYLSLCTLWSLYHFQMLNCVISIAGGTLFIVKSSTIINGNQLAN
jgi:hypothetical protein